MVEIYVRDELIPKESRGNVPNRRSQEDIDTILTSIIPRPPTSIRLTPLGFVTSYSLDEDANKLFKPETITKLKDAKLTAKLSYNTQLQREIYILNTPEDIYNKQEANLIIELEQQNDIYILHLEKFTSKTSRKRYIKITLETEIIKNRIASIGKLKLFSTLLPATSKITKTSQATDSTTTAAAAAAAATAQPGAPRHGYYNTESGQHRGMAIPNRSSWAGHRTQPHASAPRANFQNHSNSNSGQGLLPTPPSLATLQIQKSDHELKAFMQATGMISEKLSEGLLNPENFVSNVNDILIQHGHSAIHVPTSLLDSSRATYDNRNTITFLNDLRLQNPHTFQQSNAPQTSPNSPQNLSTQSHSATPNSQAPNPAPPSEPPTQPPRTPSPEISPTPLTNNSTPITIDVTPHAHDSSPAPTTPPSNALSPVMPTLPSHSPSYSHLALPFPLLSPLACSPPFNPSTSPTALSPSYLAMDNFTASYNATPPNTVTTISTTSSIIQQTKLHSSASASPPYPITPLSSHDNIGVRSMCINNLRTLRSNTRSSNNSIVLNNGSSE